MENNIELLAQVTARAKTWLSDIYDKETQKEVEALLNKDDKSD